MPIRPLRLLPILALTVLAAGHLRAQVSPLWTDATPGSLGQPPENGEMALTSVDFGNGTFVAAGYQYSFVIGTPGVFFTFTSPDGLNWTRHDGAPSGGRVRFVNGNFLLASSPDPESSLYASPDGVTWTRTADLGKGAGTIDDLASGNGLTVLGRAPNDTIDDAPLPAVSADLLHWSANTVGPTDEYTSLSHVAFLDGRFILVGNAFQGPRAYTSADGANWSAASPASASSGFSWIAAGNGVALLPSGYHDFQISTDGINWSTASPGLQLSSIYGVTSPIPLLYARFVNGRFVGAANNYDQQTFGIYASADAQNWTRFGAVPGRYAVNDLAFGNGAYVAVTNVGIYRVAASAVETDKRCLVGGVVDGVTIKTKAQKARQVISGTFTLTNSGTQVAKGVQVSLFLSRDQTLNPPGQSTEADEYLGTVTLADAGSPKIGRNGKSTGPVPFKFHIDTYHALSTSGNYLLMLIDPQHLLNEDDRTGELVVYGPLP